MSIIGNDSIISERKEHNENYRNAVAVAWDGCASKNIVGHIPLNRIKVASKFLQFSNHHIHIEVTGERVNLVVGLGIKIPVNYFLMEMEEL